MRRGALRRWRGCWGATAESRQRQRQPTAQPPRPDPSRDPRDPAPSARSAALAEKSTRGRQGIAHCIHERWGQSVINGTSSRLTPFRRKKFGSARRSQRRQAPPGSDPDRRGRPGVRHHHGVQPMARIHRPNLRAVIDIADRPLDRPERDHAPRVPRLGQRLRAALLRRHHPTVAEHSRTARGGVVRPVRLGVTRPRGAHRRICTTSGLRSQAPVPVCGQLPTRRLRLPGGEGSAAP